jgi:hydroxymethylbilane synthase
VITIGSRGSQLALWQARWVESKLTALGETCRIEIIKTTGDKVTDVPLAKVGGKGLFTKEIEDALLAGAVDVAVHSLKDMPTDLPAGLTLQAVPEREDAHDAMVGRTLDELPRGARVGTSSLRRSAQLRALRPDLDIETIRGNLDTRLRKLDEGQFDAIVLAAAGLRRLGWGSRIAQLLPPEVCCPAVGQGALAIETRDDQGTGALLCRKLDDRAARAAVTAERALLGALGGGCQVPIGAHATVSEGALVLNAVVAAPDGSQIIKGERTGAANDGARIGADLARELLANGARGILDAVYGNSAAPANVSLT